MVPCAKIRCCGSALVSMRNQIQIGSRDFRTKFLKIFLFENKNSHFSEEKGNMYLSLGVHEERKSYRRSPPPQPSREHPALTYGPFPHRFLFSWVIFALLDQDLPTKINADVTLVYNTGQTLREMSDSSSFYL
jgi:hypothetical protein